VGALANVFADVAHPVPSEAALFELDTLPPVVPEPQDRDAIAATIDMKDVAPVKPLAPAKVAGAVTRLSKGREPLLRQPCEPSAAEDGPVPPTVAIARRNPLRLATTGTETTAVVPAAAWTASASQSRLPSPTVRRNPLRDN